MSTLLEPVEGCSNCMALTHDMVLILDIVKRRDAEIEALENELDKLRPKSENSCGFSPELPTSKEDK